LIDLLPISYRCFPSNHLPSYLRFMAKQSPKQPAARLSDWGATGGSIGKRRLLTRAQYAELRRKLADVDAKLRQLGAAERGRQR
jgi:hypothetical protein